MNYKSIFYINYKYKFANISQITFMTLPLYHFCCCRMSGQLLSVSMTGKVRF